MFADPALSKPRCKAMAVTEAKSPIRHHEREESSPLPQVLKLDIMVNSHRTRLSNERVSGVRKRTDWKVLLAQTDHKLPLIERYSAVPRSLSAMHGYTSLLVFLDKKQRALHQ